MTYGRTICSAHQRRSRHLHKRNMEPLCSTKQNSAASEPTVTWSKQMLEETFTFLLFTSLPDALTPFIHSMLMRTFHSSWSCCWTPLWRWRRPLLWLRRSVALISHLSSGSCNLSSNFNNISIFSKNNALISLWTEQDHFDVFLRFIRNGKKIQLKFWYQPLFYTSNWCWINYLLTKKLQLSFPLRFSCLTQLWSSCQQTWGLQTKLLVPADNLQDWASAGFYLGTARPTGRGRTVQAQVKHSRCEQACRTTWWAPQSRIRQALRDTPRTTWHGKIKAAPLTL